MNITPSHRRFRLALVRKTAIEARKQSAQYRRLILILDGRAGLLSREYWNLVKGEARMSFKLLHLSCIQIAYQVRVALLSTLLLAPIARALRWRLGKPENGYAGGVERKCTKATTTTED